MSGVGVGHDPVGGGITAGMGNAGNGGILAGHAA